MDHPPVNIDIRTWTCPDSVEHWAALCQWPCCGWTSPPLPTQRRAMYAAHDHALDEHRAELCGT